MSITCDDVFNWLDDDPEVGKRAWLYGYRGADKRIHFRGMPGVMDLDDECEEVWLSRMRFSPYRAADGRIYLRSRCSDWTTCFNGDAGGYATSTRPVPLPWNWQHTWPWTCQIQAPQLPLIGNLGAITCHWDCWYSPWIGAILWLDYDLATRGKPGSYEYAWPYTYPWGGMVDQRLCAYVWWETATLKEYEDEEPVAEWEEIKDSARVYAMNPGAEAHEALKLPWEWRADITGGRIIGSPPDDDIETIEDIQYTFQRREGVDVPLSGPPGTYDLNIAQTFQPTLAGPPEITTPNYESTDFTGSVSWDYPAARQYDEVDGYSSADVCLAWRFIEQSIAVDRAIEDRPTHGYFYRDKLHRPNWVNLLPILAP